MTYIILPDSAPVVSRCRIAYDNLLEKGTVTASSENAEYPVENCFDGNNADYFRPASGGTVNIDLTLAVGRTANYFAFYAQNLFQLGGSIKLQYHNGSDYVDATSGISPGDNAPRIFFFDDTTATQWRIVVTCASVFSLGMVSFGEYLALQHGMYRDWTPPLLGRANQLLNSVSDSGAFLGRSIVSKGVRTTIKLQYATDAWVRDDWLAFVQHAEQKPFWFAPNVEDYPTEVALCWTDGDIPAPVHTHYGYMGVDVPIRGLVE
jgi:hypothetical protein